jgi:hypothetical protein
VTVARLVAIIAAAAAAATVLRLAVGTGAVVIACVSQSQQMLLCGAWSN